MKKLLCRHRDEDMFKILGYGLVMKELSHSQVLVEWLLTKRMNFMMKKYLYILDETEVNGYRS